MDSLSAESKVGQWNVGSFGVTGGRWVGRGEVLEALWHPRIAGRGCTETGANGRKCATPRSLGLVSQSMYSRAADRFYSGRPVRRVSRILNRSECRVFASWLAVSVRIDQHYSYPLHRIASYRMHRGALLRASSCD